jgi:hypothetical protein
MLFTLMKQKRGMIVFEEKYNILEVLFFHTKSRFSEEGLPLDALVELQKLLSPEFVVEEGPLAPGAQFDTSRQQIRIVAKTEEFTSADQFEKRLRLVVGPKSFPWQILDVIPVDRKN